MADVLKTSSVKCPQLEKGVTGVGPGARRRHRDRAGDEEDAECVGVESPSAGPGSARAALAALLPLPCPWSLATGGGPAALHSQRLPARRGGGGRDTRPRTWLSRAGRSWAPCCRRALVLAGFGQPSPGKAQASLPAHCGAFGPVAQPGPARSLARSISSSNAPTGASLWPA